MGWELIDLFPSNHTERFTGLNNKELQKYQAIKFLDKLPNIEEEKKEQEDFKNSHDAGISE